MPLVPPVKPASQARKKAPTIGRYCRELGFPEAEIIRSVGEAQDKTRAALAALRELQGTPETKRRRPEPDARESIWRAHSYWVFFGEYDSSRFKRVLRTVEKVDRYLNSGWSRIVCGGGSSAGMSHTTAFPIASIELQSFWKSRLNNPLSALAGPDSARQGEVERTRVIIHEFAHNAGANRFARWYPEVYGYEATRRIAIGNPEHAVRNADSYALFIMDGIKRQSEYTRPRSPG